MSKLLYKILPLDSRNETSAQSLDEEIGALKLGRWGLGGTLRHWQDSSLHMPLKEKERSSRILNLISAATAFTAERMYNRTCQMPYCVVVATAATSPSSALPCNVQVSNVLSTISLILRNLYEIQSRSLASSLPRLFQEGGSSSSRSFQHYPCPTSPSVFPSA